MADKWRWVWMSRKIIRTRFIWKFRTITISMQRTKSTVLHLNIPLKVKCLNWILDGPIGTCSSWGIQVSILREIKKSSTFWKVRTVKILMHGTQIDNETKTFSLPTLLEEIKPVVLVKYDSKLREKYKLKSFLCKFRTTRILMRRKKQGFLLWILIYKC